MKCKRKNKWTGLEISKATLHIAEAKGSTDRIHLIRNKENSCSELDI
jgi:hypothetical protein